ncbi:WXG100 family type VII secretion target [Nocardioides sp. KR10-350]|uniref:WXG100 family type VII secretion target n=1 Tax=Nocardioides cheoyonin TaxID=3156615 RepID=UPI0032B5AD6B
MSNDQIYIKHASLDEARAHLEMGVKDIDSTLTNLEHQLNPLRANFSGLAKEAYQLAQQMWDGAITDMKAALLKHGQLVQDANDGFRDADKKAASYFEG